jgi:DNA-binding NarL/FixJ family response regulator
MNASNNSNQQAAARILIVEDHPVVRRGLVELINAEPDLKVCGEADDAPAAVQLLGQVHPDLVVIDISLKRGNGIDLVKQIKARDNQIKLLVTSVHDESLYAERALRAGAMGYLNKSEPIPMILNAIRQVLRGRIFLSMPMVNRMLQSPVQDSEESPISSLSDRELQVFELISRGLTTREIATKLLRSIKTIETHRDHIRMKLKLKNSTELIHHAVQWFLESNAALRMANEPSRADVIEERDSKPVPPPPSPAPSRVEVGASGGTEAVPVPVAAAAAANRSTYAAPEASR